MANHVHDRVNLANGHDRTREALVMVNADPKDKVSLSIHSIEMEFRIDMTRPQARALAALLALAGEE